jgi:uncharacterized membrane protein YphA (DoxX/SURF4 family)
MNMSEIPLPPVNLAWAGAGVVFVVGALICAARSIGGPRVEMPRGQVQVSLLTAYLLVWLRLAIGWHFIVEGYDKIESVWRGPTETSKPWTSEAYLREATGPLAAQFRQLAGDPDEQLLALLQVGDSKAEPAAQRLAAPLNDQWESYFERFAAQFGLKDEQRTKARDVFENHKNALGRWLVEGNKTVEKYFPSGTVKAPMSTPERVAAYRAKLLEVRDMLDKELPAFESDVGKARLAAAKADLRRWRTELQSDLNDAFAKMRTELEGVLTAEQKKLGASPTPPVHENTMLQWVDWLTRWGLFAVGACLLLGLLTRPACLSGAALLFLFYLAMPPLPGVPDNPRAEGHYLFINKNIIEMLALLALASTRSGTWLGLDGLLQFLSPFSSSRVQANATRPIDTPANS